MKRFLTKPVITFNFSQCPMSKFV